MTPDRLEGCLSVLTGVRRRVSGGGPSDRAVARLVDRTEKVVAGWRREGVPVPEDLAEWLERRTAQRLSRPMPELPRNAGASRPRRENVPEAEAAERAARIERAMERLGWKPAILSREIERSPETVRRWLKGVAEQAAPLPLVEWVERAALVGLEKAGPVPDLGPGLSDSRREAPALALRLQRAMDRLDWGITEVARQVDRTFEGVRQWTLGKVPAPVELVEWMETLAADAEADPPPSWVLPGGVRLAELQRGVELLREAGLGRVAKLLERAPDLVARSAKASGKPERLAAAKMQKAARA